MSAVSFRFLSSVSANVSQTHLIAEVEELKVALSKGDLSGVREIAQALSGAGRKLVASHILEKEETSPLSITLMLFEALASDRLQWEDETKHCLARCARLFMELTCIKCTKEKRTLYPETKKSLREQTEKILNHAKQEQVGLIYELKCSSEALKLMEEMDPKYTLFLLETLTNLGMSSISGLLKEIPNLVKQIGKDWFSEALYIYWIGTLARENLELFKEQQQMIAQRLDTLEIAQTAVEFFGDLILNGSSNISYMALTGKPGLIVLANQKDPKFTLLRSTMWPVRYRAIEILSELTNHADPKIASAATQALLDCRLRESNPIVKKLLEQLEQRPKIQSQWIQEFGAKKEETIQENLSAALEKMEKSLQACKQDILERDAANQLDSKKLQREREAIEEERRSIEARHNEFFATQGQAKEQNLLEHQILETQKKDLAARVRDLAREQDLQQQASKRLQLEKKDVEQEQLCIKMQLEECLAYRKNIEEMHLKIKGFQEVLNAVLIAQSHIKPEEKKPIKEDKKIPMSYCCPITLELMKDPVMADDDYTYERSAIEKHLITSHISPFTRQPISKNLRPNRAIRDAIEEYKDSLPKPLGLIPPSLDSLKQDTRSKNREVDSMPTFDQQPPTNIDNSINSNDEPANRQIQRKDCDLQSIQSNEPVVVRDTVKIAKEQSKDNVTMSTSRPLYPILAAQEPESLPQPSSTSVVDKLPSRLVVHAEQPKKKVEEEASHNEYPWFKEALTSMKEQDNSPNAVSLERKWTLLLQRNTDTLQGNYFDMLFSSSEFTINLEDAEIMVNVMEKVTGPIGFIKGYRITEQAYACLRKYSTHLELWKNRVVSDKA